MYAENVLITDCIFKENFANKLSKNIFVGFSEIEIFNTQFYDE